MTNGLPLKGIILGEESPSAIMSLTPLRQPEMLPRLVGPGTQEAPSGGVSFSNRQKIYVKWIYEKHRKGGHLSA